MCCGRFDEAITHVTKIYEQLAATEELTRSYKSTASSDAELTEQASLKTWRKAKTAQTLASVSRVFKEAGEALVQIAAKYGNRMLFQRYDQGCNFS